MNEYLGGSVGAPARLAAPLARAGLLAAMLVLGSGLAGVGGAWAQGAGDGEAQPGEDPEPGALPSAEMRLSRDPHRGPVTNLPMPRYVSLKGSEGNARRGPSLSHRIDWVFRHAGMPLRVTAEYGHWRRVEDSDGAGGWVHYSLLSGVRTALIEQDMAELHARPAEDSAVTARAEAGAIVKLGACEPAWCQVSGGGASGWLPKGAIWGVDPGETRE